MRKLVLPLLFIFLALQMQAQVARPGSRDPLFTPPANGLGSISFIEDMEIQADGKILLNSLEANEKEYYVVRMLPTGVFDPAFNNRETASFNGFVDVIALQDDKIVLGGRFTTVDGSTLRRIARFNADGSLDNTFTAGSGFDGGVASLHVQPDDKILAGGDFTTYNGSSFNRLVRLNANGTIDATFAIGTGLNGRVATIERLPDGKIIIAGGFDSYNGTPVSKIARLNSDGSIDATFTPPTIDNGIRALAFQADGKILIGGAFANVGGVSRNSIARLNADGSHDLSFDPGTGFNNTVFSLRVESSGKIMVGGWYDQFNGLTQNYLTRLRPDGSRDMFFDVINGPNSNVAVVRPFTTDKVYVAGYFELWDGALHNAVAVVNNACITDPTGIDNSSCNGSITISASGGSNGQYRWYTQASGGSAISGETNSSLSLTALANTTTYYVSLNDGLCESNRVPVVATINLSPPPTVTPASRCGAGAITVSASGGTDGQYRWYTQATGGIPLTSETNSSLTIPSLASTTTYYVSINDGSCETPRASVVATITSVTPPAVSSASRCDSGPITLTASGGANGQYRWYSTSTGGSAISGEVNGAFSTPAVTATTTYFVTLTDGTCESSRVPVDAVVTPLPAAPSAASVSVCAGTSATVTATGGTNGSYRWYTTASGGTAIPGEVNSSYQTPLLTITATYFVSVVSGSCESERTPVLVTLTTCTPNQPPQFANATLNTQIGGSVTLNLLSLISDADNNLDAGSVRIIQQPESGATASIDGSGNLLLSYAGLNFAGTDHITIEACDFASACTQFEIAVEVIGDLIVYNAISPNGDGANEIFFIQYIDVLPDTKSNKVTIYNRWGDVVFHVSDYDNVNRVFRGISNKGSELPGATYFYRIEFPDRKEVSGYLSLKK